MHQLVLCLIKSQAQNKITHPRENIAENSVVDNTIRHDKLRSMLKRSNS